jgi:hypothetical protein
MSSTLDAFADCLLRRERVSPDQLDDARRLSQQTGERIDRALVRLGYLSSVEVMKAWAEALGLTYVDLTDVVIPPAVIEMLPESVARTYAVLPLTSEDRVFVVAVSDPCDADLVQKLEFILNRTVRTVLAPREQIVEAINRFYGQSETESVDSMLVEFTDTAIDFTQTEAAAIDLEFVPPAPAPRLGPAASPSPANAPLVSRRATVRYYERMNPERTYPLLVVLSAKDVQKVAQRGVAQAKSQAFQVAEGSLVEVEPILPGCACYPPKEQVPVAGGEVTVTFWVVPHVLGKVARPRVVVRQEGRQLAEVPLEIRIVRQSAAVLLGSLSLVLPFVLLLLKHFNLDFESQLKDGFGLYAQIAGWLIHHLTPELLTGLLLAGTAALYLCCRPRRRDVFWDVEFAGASGAAAPPQEPARQEPAGQDERRLAALLDADPFHQDALLSLADRRFKAGNHAGALAFYQRALAVGPLRAIHYFRASLSASLAGDDRRALEILERAKVELPAGQVRGPMWFNMGCFAARLGRFALAMRYLTQAVDAGYTDATRYREDADLEPLRWRPEFRRLLVDLAV